MRRAVPGASLRALAVVAAFIVATIPGAAQNRRTEAAQLMSELMSGTSTVGGPFVLSDPGGRRVALADFRGKIVLLYFGFTSCPDVCPTDLAVIGQMMHELGREADEVQPIFITLDPQRDTPAVLREYAAAFHPRLMALSGTEAEIRRIATDYKVFFEKVALPGTKTYTIDHMTFTFLLDRQGRYVAFFPPGTPADRMGVMVREQPKSFDSKNREP
jgi:cytochrome oxidase Cu insertion factor (SCO1/SenC/PrrC family)